MWFKDKCYLDKDWLGTDHTQGVNGDPYLTRNNYKRMKVLNRINELGKRERGKVDQSLYF